MTKKKRYASTTTFLATRLDAIEHVKSLGFTEEAPGLTSVYVTLTGAHILRNTRNLDDVAFANVSSLLAGKRWRVTVREQYVWSP